MSHKKAKNKQKHYNHYKGYNQNEQANGNFNQDILSEKYKENSNAQE